MRFLMPAVPVHVAYFVSGALFELGDQLENDFLCCTGCEHRNVNGACSGRNKKNGRRTNKCDPHDPPPVTHHILQAAEEVFNGALA
jgi:hypothetical protein